MSGGWEKVNTTAFQILEEFFVTTESSVEFY